MSVGRVLAAGVQRLRAATADSSTAAGADLDAQVLLAHVLAIARAQLRSHPETPADPQRIPTTSSSSSGGPPASPSPI